MYCCPLGLGADVGPKLQATRCALPRRAHGAYAARTMTHMHTAASHPWCLRSACGAPMVSACVFLHTALFSLRQCMLVQAAAVGKECVAINPHGPYI